jgi:hypothetical protein
MCATLGFDSLLSAIKPRALRILELEAIQNSKTGQPRLFSH